MANSNSLTFLAKTLLAGLAAGLAGVSSAQAPAVAPHASPELQVLQQEKQRAAELRQAAANAGRIDTKAPKLKSIDVSGGVNAQRPEQTAQASVNLHDDLSGIAFYEIGVRSPSGAQHLYRYKYVPTPLLAVNGNLTIGSVYSFPGFTAFDEPGTWIADYFYARDVKGNAVEYDEQQLHTLGPTTFQVSNTGGWDNVAPGLSSSSIDTPVVHMSTPPQGMPAGTPPFVSATLDATDSGVGGVVSGTYVGYVGFCLPDGNGGCTDSFSMQGVSNRSGLAANALTVGTQLRVGQATGTYSIYYVELYDIAQNLTYITSNFGNYFASTTITVDP